MDENEIGSIIVDCAIQLHKELGPGLLESVYEAVLAQMLQERGLSVRRQASVPIQFRGQRFIDGFRADLMVNDTVIIELKSVETASPVWKKQLLTYLRLTGMKVGYLLNFNVSLMKDGITRIINGNLSAP